MNVACMTRLLLMGVMQNLKSLKLKLYKGAPKMICTVMVVHTHIEVEVRHRYVDTSHVIRVMWFLCTVKKSVINF